MTTTVTVTVGTSGRTYSTIQSAIDSIAASSADLVTADKEYILELYNDSEFNPSSGTLTISGHTTDATRNITLRPATGQGRRDSSTKAADKWNYDQSKGVGVQFSTGFAVHHFTVSSPYTTLDGLQFFANYGSSQSVLYVTGANCAVSNCLVYRPATGNTAAGCVGGASTVKFINCVMIDGSGSDASAFGADDSCTFINCTAFKSSGSSSRRAFSNQYSSPLVINCIGIGYAAFCRPGFGPAAGSDYNATDLASGSANLGAGSHNLYSLVASDVFVSAVDGTTTDVRIKAGAAVIAAGSRAQYYTSDLDAFSTARSTTTPTIGANEYASSGGGGPTTYNLTQSDSTTASESIASSIAVSLLLADALTAADSSISTLLSTSGVSESGSVSGTLTSFLSSSATVPETVTALDASTPLMSVTAAMTETGAIYDGPTSFEGFSTVKYIFAGGIESVSAAETLTNTVDATLVGEILDYLSAAGSFVSNTPGVAKQSDVINSIDAPVLHAPDAAAQTESVTLTATIQNTVQVSSNMVEAVSVAAIHAHIPNIPVSLAETLVASESINFFSSFSLSSLDSFTIDESTGLLQAIFTVSMFEAGDLVPVLDYSVNMQAVTTDVVVLNAQHAANMSPVVVGNFDVLSVDDVTAPISRIYASVTELVSALESQGCFIFTGAISALMRYTVNADNRKFVVGSDNRIYVVMTHHKN